MGSSIITERFRRVFWFFALWVGGVGAAFLLALPFRLLIRFGASFH
jgi:hypothetical protein